MFYVGFQPHHLSLMGTDVVSKLKLTTLRPLMENGDSDSDTSTISIFNVRTHINSIRHRDSISNIIIQHCLQVALISRWMLDPLVSSVHVPILCKLVLKLLVLTFMTGNVCRLYVSFLHRSNRLCFISWKAKAYR